MCTPPLVSLKVPPSPQTRKYKGYCCEFEFALFVQGLKVLPRHVESISMYLSGESMISMDGLLRECSLTRHLSLCSFAL